MKRTLLTWLTMILFAGVISAQDVITIYRDCEFRGESEKLYVGRYILRGMRVGADAISSIRIPYGLKVTLYDGAEPGQGSKITLTSDTRCLDGNWNDRARAIVVDRNYGSSGNYNYNNNRNNNYGNYSDDAVQIFDNCNYGGTSKRLTDGWYNDKDLIGNDRISSIRIPRGYKVTVFKDDDFKGTKLTYYTDIRCLYGSWDNAISSIHVERTDGGGNYNSGGGSGGGRYYDYGDAITVYEDCNFRGNNHELKEGYYKYNQLGVGSDKISSIRIPRGFRVVVYSDTDFKGYKREYRATQNCLTADINDKISSIEVFRY